MMYPLSMSVELADLRLINVDSILVCLHSNVIQSLESDFSNSASRSSSSPFEFSFVVNLLYGTGIQSYI